MSLAGRGPLLLFLFFPPAVCHPLSLLFHLELGFPNPYTIAVKAQKFIAGRVEELKRLRIIRTDSKLNSLMCVAFNSYLLGVLVVNRNLKYQFDKLSIIFEITSCVPFNLIVKLLLFQWQERKYNSLCAIKN